MPDVAIAGGGLVGLITALMLARRGHQVVLFDSDADPADGTAEDDFFRWTRPGRRGLLPGRQPPDHPGRGAGRRRATGRVDAFLDTVEDGPDGLGPLPRAEFEALLR